MVEVFLLKFQTLIIIVTTNVTVCALRNGVWYSSFLCSFPNYFCMMAQTSVTSFVGFLNISGTRVIYERVWKRKNYFGIVSFLSFERGSLRAGNSNKNLNKHLLVALGFPDLYPIIYNPVQNTKLLLLVPQNFQVQLFLDSKYTVRAMNLIEKKSNK